ncbi:hypothetical protein Tco_0273819 [Tanacetum coccineum]
MASLCVQDEPDFRPNMSIMVSKLQPLLNAAPAPVAKKGSGFVRLGIVGEEDDADEAEEQHVSSYSDYVSSPHIHTEH